MAIEDIDPKYQAGDPPCPEDIAPDMVISPDTRRENRVPPGQSRTRKWPVLHATVVPQVNTHEWTLEVTGLVDTPQKWTWDEFQALPRVKVFADFHCVTRWSRLGNVWEGVSVAEILRRTGARPNAKFVVVGGYDADWTTNLPFADFNVEDALLADTHDGRPIDADHGGPVRLIVPRLYAWKSAKWVKSIELVADDQLGYWERGGYHSHGDPWVVDDQNPDGERFQNADAIPPGFTGDAAD